VDGTGAVSAAQGLTVSAGGATVGGSSLVVSTTADTTSGTSGAIYTLGGLGVSKKVFVGTGLTVSSGGATISSGALVLSDGTPSTSKTSGALLVSGGVGVGGSVYVGVTMSAQNVLGANAYQTTSDRRYKTDIAQLQSALNKVKQLRGVKYSWRRDEFPHKGFSPGLQSGFIAQEVEEVIPDAVDTAPDGYKTLRSSYITPYLVEAVKSLEAQLADQAARYAADMERLEKRLKLAERRAERQSERHEVVLLEQVAHLATEAVSRRLAATSPADSARHHYHNGSSAAAIYGRSASPVTRAARAKRKRADWWVAMLVVALVVVDLCFQWRLSGRVGAAEQWVAHEKGESKRKRRQPHEGMAAR